MPTLSAPLVNPPPCGVPDASARSPELDSDFTDRITPELPRLVATARAYLPSDDLAWDAVQETLLRVWSQGYLPENAGPALRALVAQSCLHLLRCERRRRAYESDAGPTACCPDDPLVLLTETENRAALVDALRTLASDYRTVFELYELEGRSYAEIAVALRIPVGTVRSRLCRARARLKERLAGALAAA